MAYVITPLTETTHRIFRCRLCQRPGWKWFPKGSNAKKRKIAAPPAHFLVGNRVSLPDGTVKLCDYHTRALCGDAAVDQSVIDALAAGNNYPKESL